MSSESTPSESRPGKHEVPESLLAEQIEELAKEFPTEAANLRRELLKIDPDYDWERRGE